MAKKKILKIIKLQIPAGKANPAPPIGPALGSAGINIMNFCKDFNARTQKQAGDILPVIIEVYQDKSFSFITLKTPVAEMIKKELSLEKGSAKPNTEKVGKLKISQARKIAQEKMSDMRTNSLEAATRMVMGTARQMGVDIIEG